MQLTLPYPSYQIRELGGFTLREATLEVDVKPELADPAQVADFWRGVVAHSPRYDASVENLVAFHLNTRRRLLSYRIISQGTLDTLLTHPREIFRAAILESASVIILGHNHPSGDPSPSEADIKVTRDLMRAGQTLKIELLDHVILGHPGHQSLRASGYFH
jgi:DNA repair protein RadC